MSFPPCRLPFPFRVSLLSAFLMKTAWFRPDPKRRESRPLLLLLLLLLLALLPLLFAQNERGQNSVSERGTKSLVCRNRNTCLTQRNSNRFRREWITRIKPCMTSFRFFFSFFFSFSSFYWMSHLICIRSALDCVTRRFFFFFFLPFFLFFAYYVSLDVLNFLPSPVNQATAF